MKSLFIIISLLLRVLVHAIRPIVLYRGLNSTCCGGSTQRLHDELKAALPDVFIYSVQLSVNPTVDRLRSSFDNAQEQVAAVATQLRGVPELKGGFNAVGLSQGGLLMRAYIEKYNDPPVYRFVTLGSPHGGIADLPSCGEESIESLTQRIKDMLGIGRLPGKIICNLWQSLFRKVAYSEISQAYILPAQYYRDPRRLEEYKQADTFLADINNEFRRNQTYIENLSGLELFVMFRYTKDELVIPSYSEWFATASIEGENDEFNITQLAIYREDRIGLQKLNSMGRLQLRAIAGQHLTWPEDFVRVDLSKYFQ
jgi:palmitoyl-protein thioesterase